MVRHIHVYILIKLQLNMAKSFDTDAPFLGLDLSIIHVSVSSKIHDQQKDFNFEIVIFHFMMEMFLTPLPMVYTFQNISIHFARVCSSFSDFNNRN